MFYSLFISADGASGHNVAELSEFLQKSLGGIITVTPKKLVQSVSECKDLLQGKDIFSLI